MAAGLHGYVELKRRLGAIQSAEAGEAMMKRLGMATVREAKALVPRKTGNLGRSIHVSSQSKYRVTVEAGAHYGVFMELGTRPHLIVPVRARVLAWPTTAAGARLSGSPTKAARRGSLGLGGSGLGGSGGITMLGGVGPHAGPMTFAREVHHPGTAPRPFLVPGAQAAIRKTKMLDLVVERWNSAA